ncbi:hypothetical protein ABI59_19945 [Acidobacteria bacterium Mor1]|nr:hypothetical protein ABI59_19945 [Acidobacteria bacterium Mor1]
MNTPITQILEHCDGDPEALQQRLLPVVYESLRRMARRQLARERRASLQPTALVHEAYLRLFRDDRAFENRRHFYGAAAESMRRILVEQARRRERVRHGGHLVRASLDPDGLSSRNDTTTIQLDDVLDRFEARSPRPGMVVKLRYFLGLSIEETASLMQLSPTTVKADWSFARAWLHRELRGRPRRDVRG